VPGAPERAAQDHLESEMDPEITLKKAAALPEFLQQAFKFIDAKDFESLEGFFADDFKMFFAHYVLHGFKQGIGFVAAFDRRLPKYEHVMGDIFLGEGLITFDGLLRIWLEDGSVVETPFWDKIEVDPATGRITTMYALFSIAAAPERYWRDLKPEDFS
jgi:hypothetical protein